MSLVLLERFICLYFVWTHYKETKQSISSENESLINLWNSTDYLNDPNFSKEMKQTLLAYLNTVITDEFKLYKTRDRVDLPSIEFIGIKEALNRISFDDSRDPIAFGSLIDSHRTLSKARSRRIENCCNVMPHYFKDVLLLSHFG